MEDLNFIQIFVDIENSDDKNVYDTDFQCEVNLDHVKREDVVTFLEYYKEMPELLYDLVASATREKLKVEGN